MNIPSWRNEIQKGCAPSRHRAGGEGRRDRRLRLFFRPKTDSVSDPFFYRKKVVFIPQDPLRTPPGPSWGALGARRWILLDFLLILGSILGPQNGFRISRGAQGTPQKAKKKEERAKVTAAGAEGDRQKYMTVGICRLIRFRALPGTILGPLGSPRGSL